MTIADLKQNPLFAQLTSKQQVFVETYVTSNGSKVAAAKAAWAVSSDKAAEGMAGRALKVYRIRELLSAYYGYDVGDVALTKNELIALVSQRLRSGTLSDREFGSMVQVYLSLRNWTKSLDRVINEDRAIGERLRRKSKQDAAEAPSDVDVMNLVRQLEDEDAQD